MKPLNFAILKYFTTVDEACVYDVMDALRGQYSNFRAFTKKGMDEALMTAASNGLIEETRLEFDRKGDLLIYYHANEDGKAAINSYIKD